MPDMAQQYATVEADTDHANGWTALDLTATVEGLQDGSLTRPEPTVGDFGDGCLFYRDRVNGVHGDSTAGKTWTALVTCCQELAAGEAVVYVDLEDDPAGIVGRLLDLGADPDAARERFIYLRPEGRLNQAAADSLARMLAERVPSVAVVDSTGEALALEGANPNADEEVARWFRLLPRLLARHGAAVLLLDHATKNGENDLWPIGSQRKRAAITGAAYRQKQVRPFAQGQDGRAVLTCAKDRHGAYAIGQRVAELVVSAGTFSLESAGASVGAGEAFRPTVLMERVSEHLDLYPGSTGADVRKSVHGKDKALITALACLVAEGYVSIESGPRNAKLHTNVRRFYETADDDGGNRSAPRTRESDPCPVPVPKGGEQGTGHFTCSGNRSGTGREQVARGCLRLLRHRARRRRRARCRRPLYHLRAQGGGAMSRHATSLGVRPEAVHAFLALADVLDRMTDDGHRPVCEQRPDQWSSDANPPARQDAAAACDFCPAQPACLAYAIAQREPAGVWGGRDFTPVSANRKEKAA